VRTARKRCVSASILLSGGGLLTMMGRPRECMAVVAAVLLLNACSPYGLTGTLPEVDQGNSAKIVIIRPPQMKAGGTSYPIHIDGIKAYNINSGQHVSIPVTAGRRVLAVRCVGAIATNDEITTPMTLARDEVVYFKLDPTFWTCPDVTRILRDEAIEFMRETTDITGVSR
jgi:hypothetical protein